MGSSLKGTPQQRRAINRIAGLVLMNAMIFQEILAQKDHRVRPLENFRGLHDPIGPLIDHWRFILDKVNYYPIFHIAHELLSSLTADRSATQAVKQLIVTARRIVDWRAALRHDLAGRIYHRLLAEAKYLGAYYTSIPASILLLKLALRPSALPLDWSDPEKLRELRIGDMACGTGTLLMAAADVIADNHIRACVWSGREPRLDDLQEVLVKDILYGFDVVPSAVHLTASTLALRVPDVPINVTNLYCLNLGGPSKSLGSLEFLEEPEIRTQLELFGATPVPERVRGRRQAGGEAPTLPQFDLFVMNPPFTSSRQPNLLFGSIPGQLRSEMQKKLKALVRRRKVRAQITAGLAALFVALGACPTNRFEAHVPETTITHLAQDHRSDQRNGFRPPQIAFGPITRTGS